MYVDPLTRRALTLPPNIVVGVCALVTAMLTIQTIAIICSRFIKPTRLPPPEQLELHGTPMTSLMATSSLLLKDTLAYCETCEHWRPRTASHCRYVRWSRHISTWPILRSTLTSTLD